MVAITYHEYCPNSQCCPEPVFVQCPIHDKRRYRTEHTGPSPENAVRKTFPFHEPLIKVEDDGIIKQGPSHAIEKTLRENEMNDMSSERSSHQPGSKCAQTYYRDLLSSSRPAIQYTSQYLDRRLKGSSRDRYSPSFKYRDTYGS